MTLIIYQGLLNLVDILNIVHFLLLIGLEIALSANFHFCNILFYNLYDYQVLAANSLIYILTDFSPFGKLIKKEVSYHDSLGK